MHTYFHVIYLGYWYKYLYEIPWGFEYRMCTLTIPTICTSDTVMKVVGRIKQWRDFLAKNCDCGYFPRLHKQRATPSLMPPSPSSPINPTIVRHQPSHRCYPCHCASHHPPRHTPFSAVDSHHHHPGHRPPPPLPQSTIALPHEQQR